MGIELFSQAEKPHDVISFEEFQKRKVRRRKRVAKRMQKRFPLFAVQFMQEEFPLYTLEQWEKDIIRKRKPKPKKGKSQLARMGRYNLMKSYLHKYDETGDVDFAYKAEMTRRKLYCYYELCWVFEKSRVWAIFRPEVNYKRVLEISKLNSVGKTPEELKDIIKKDNFYETFSPYVYIEKKQSNRFLLK